MACRNPACWFADRVWFWIVSRILPTDILDFDENDI